MQINLSKQTGKVFFFAFIILLHNFLSFFIFFDTLHEKFYIFLGKARVINFKWKLLCKTRLPDTNFLKIQSTEDLERVQASGNNGRKASRVLWRVVALTQSRHLCKLFSLKKFTNLIWNKRSVKVDVWLFETAANCVLINCLVNF